MLNKIVLFLSFALVFFSGSIVSQNSLIDTLRLKKHVYTLASDSLGGRFPGTKGDSIAANYIMCEMQANGASTVFIQNFDIITGVKSGKNELIIGNEAFVFGKDFSVYGFSTSSFVNSDIVILGKMHIISSEDSALVKSKWIITYRADQMTDNGETDRDKAQMLTDIGAGGIIFVSDLTNFSPDKLVVLNENLGKLTIPVLHISRKIAEEILLGCSIGIDFLKSELIVPLGLKISAKTEILPVEVTTHNVIGIVKAEKNRNVDQPIVLGAHYDHLGFGGVGTSSRQQDTLAVHYGADDNASGVAVMLELIKQVSQNSSILNRDIVFVAFGAEERGLLGSEFFTSSNALDFTKVNAMINLDMVGRLREDKTLQISGIGTSLQTDSLLNIINKNYNFKFALSPEGYGPSDHATFYAKNIPVFYISTGAHGDYHTPKDKAQKINYKGMAEITSYVHSLILEINNIQNRLSFQEAGPKGVTEARHGGKRKVSFGLMPSFAETDIDGLRADVVTPGKPAALAGMQNGDIIKSINGNAVHNIQEYMYRLGQLNPGDQVIVDVKRNEELIVLIIQL